MENQYFDRNDSEALLTETRRLENELMEISSGLTCNLVYYEIIASELERIAEKVRALKDL